MYIVSKDGTSAINTDNIIEIKMCITHGQNEIRFYEALGNSVLCEKYDSVGRTKVAFMLIMSAIKTNKTLFEMPLK